MALSPDLQDFGDIYDDLYRQHEELENDFDISPDEKAALQQGIVEQMNTILEVFKSAQDYQHSRTSTPSAQAGPLSSPMKRKHSQQAEDMMRNVRMRHETPDNYDFNMVPYEDDFDWGAVPYVSLPETLQGQNESDQLKEDAELAWELQRLNNPQYLAQIMKEDEEFARKLQEEERNTDLHQFDTPEPQTPLLLPSGTNSKQFENEQQMKPEVQTVVAPENWPMQYSHEEDGHLDADLNFPFFPEGSINPRDELIHGLNLQVNLPSIDSIFQLSAEEEGIEWPQSIDWREQFPDGNVIATGSADIFNLSEMPAPHLDHSKPPDDQPTPDSLPEVVPLPERTEVPFRDYANMLLDLSKNPRIQGANLDPAANAAAYHRYYGSAKTDEDLKCLLDNIQNSEFSDLREGTPDALVYPLMEHQKIGLAWMKAMEEGSNKGGILADDMGLGKTMQTLALIASRRSVDENCKTTLIIAPVSLLKQWEREIARKIRPEFAMSVHIQHYASQKLCRSFSDLARFDVVLTTFGTIASEYRRRVAWNKRQENSPEGSLEEAPELIITGKDSKWYRIIIDEAQCIKNRDTQSSKGCAELEGQYRFCLSGTPMQNSCDELYPLIRFLRIKPYNDWTTYSRDFSQPLKSKRLGRAYGNSLTKFRALIKAILLRRLKSSMIDGKPILTLPPKAVEIIHPVFSQDEQAFYTALESRVAIQFNKYLRADAVGRNYSNILLLLLRLRQACCHPHLIKDIEDPSASAVMNGDVASAANSKLIAQLPEQTVQRIKKTGLEECPVCMDMTDNPTIVIPCGHMFCRECVVQVVNLAKLTRIKSGDDNVDDQIAARCPKCRGPLDMEKLIVWRTFEQLFAEPVQNQINWEEVIGKAKKLDEDKGKGRAKADPKTMNKLRQQAFSSPEAMNNYISELEREWMTSAKVEKCMEILDEIISKSKDEKTIIFSQWTSLLQLLEVPIYRKGWKYRRYDGSMSSVARNDAVIQFTDDPDIKIMLISLKAGNSGLNLVAASQVILMDPFYNPYVEEQAIDRAYRIGQVRPLKVHRLIMEGTVEDKIIMIQNEKKALIEGALDEKAAMGIGRFSVKELAFLFGINVN